jgi:Spy/CpxP family protein refolding chaperone
MEIVHGLLAPHSGSGSSANGSKIWWLARRNTSVAEQTAVAGTKKESYANLSGGKTVMKRNSLPISFVLLAAICWAQSPAPTDDPVAQAVFAPELVMKYRQEINLDETQYRAMKEAIQKAQSKFLDLQWDMQAEQQKLVQLLKAQPVDEAAALAQVDRLLNEEREVKKAQLSLLIRIKNLLTDAQQAKLSELRRKP